MLGSQKEVGWWPQDSVHEHRGPRCPGSGGEAEVVERRLDRWAGAGWGRPGTGLAWSLSLIPGALRSQRKILSGEISCPSFQFRKIRGNDDTSREPSSEATGAPQVRDGGGTGVAQPLSFTRRKASEWGLWVTVPRVGRHQPWSQLHMGMSLMLFSILSLTQ